MFTTTQLQTGVDVAKIVRLTVDIAPLLKEHQVAPGDIVMMTVTGPAGTVDVALTGRRLATLMVAGASDRRIKPAPLEPPY
jgi:hypothetical protein